MTDGKTQPSDTEKQLSDGKTQASDEETQLIDGKKHGFAAVAIEFDA